MRVRRSASSRDSSGVVPQRNVTAKIAVRGPMIPAVRLSLGLGIKGSDLFVELFEEVERFDVAVQVQLLDYLQVAQQVLRLIGDPMGRGGVTEEGARCQHRQPDQQNAAAAQLTALQPLAHARGQKGAGRLFLL